MSRYLAAAAAAALAMCSAHAGEYDMIGTFSGQMRECFEKEMVGPQFNSETSRALATIASLTKMSAYQFQTDENAAYNDTTADRAFCRELESEGYTFQAHARQMLANRNASQADFARAVDNFSNSTRRPIWCNRIGTMTMCN